jgi:hypothetical protein
LDPTTDLSHRGGRVIIWEPIFSAPDFYGITVPAFPLTNELRYMHAVESETLRVFFQGRKSSLL